MQAAADFWHLRGARARPRDDWTCRGDVARREAAQPRIWRPTRRGRNPGAALARRPGGLRVVLPGIVVGIAAGLTLAGIVRSALVGMTVDDPETYAGIALLQTIVALVACALPAHRASRVDPSTALRAD